MAVSDAPALLALTQGFSRRRELNAELIIAAF
jgi:hypothetical protein